jgi:diguanylate cyclase (GGDEF)-like protein
MTANPGIYPSKTISLDLNTLTKNQINDLLTLSFFLWRDYYDFHMHPAMIAFFVSDNQNVILELISSEEYDLCDNTLRQGIENCLKSGQFEFASPSDKTLGIRVMPIQIESDATIGTFGVVGALYETDFSTMFHALYTSYIPYILLQAEKHASQFLVLQKHQMEQESMKKDMIFEIAQRLHAMSDVDSVLTEVIQRIKELYPLVSINLFLSQDNQNSSLTVKPLNFVGAEEDICTRAFLGGTLIHQPSLVPHETELAAPLTGKQGVYGVLHLHALPAQFDSKDIQFIQMLAGIAGTAFENAKLYEQSNFLVSELRLINEITTRLNQSLKLSEIFDFASSELMTIFGAEFSCILQMDKNENEMVVQASNLPAMFQEKYAIDYGFSGLIYTTKEPVIISDYWSNPKVQSKLMEVSGSRSLIASPIIVENEVVGVILVAHRCPNFFTYDNYKLLQILSGHIGLTIANASLHAEVKRMVITDNLTGLYARHYLDEQVNSFQKKDFCGSLIVVDIDNFKGVNDTHGHQIGDKILIQVSGIIKTCIRDSDIAARWGGEELAIYLPQVSIVQAVRIAERIRHRVVSETNPKVTVSCGVSDWHWEDEKISVELLFYKSDMALYKAKNEGKNQIKTG